MVDAAHNSMLGLCLGTRSSGAGVGVLGPSGNEWFWVSLA